MNAEQIISIDQVDHLAKLSRLRLSDQEKEVFQKELEDVLEYMGKLAEKDVESIPPFFHATFVQNAVRQDEIHETSEDRKEHIRNQFPHMHDRFLRIRAIFRDNE